MIILQTVCTNSFWCDEADNIIVDCKPELFIWPGEAYLTQAPLNGLVWVCLLCSLYVQLMKLGVTKLVLTYNHCLFSLLQTGQWNNIVLSVQSRYFIASKGSIYNFTIIWLMPGNNNTRIMCLVYPLHGNNFAGSHIVIAKMFDHCLCRRFTCSLA